MYPPVLTTLLYCVNDAGEVLLMHRQKEPNKGLWTGPGGKLEPGEAPVECARRELFEETGLSASDFVLRGLVTETSPRPDWQWILFIYRASGLSGELAEDRREGVLRWWPLHMLHTVPMPEADLIFYPYALYQQRPFYEAHFVYDEALRIVARRENGIT